MSLQEKIDQASHWVLAYYSVKSIQDPHAEITRHKDFFENLEVAGRIYISEQGINGQMSGTREAAQKYMDWMHSREEYADQVFKIHPWSAQAFERMTVKYRESLLGTDEAVNFDAVAPHVSPAEWRRMLEERDDNTILIDVRNKYG